MARKKRTPKPLPTIWEVDVELEYIEGILQELDPPARTGRPPNRSATGTQRHHLPDAHWLSVEPTSQEVWRRQLGSPHDAAMGCKGRH